ncbi:MAG: hypothetical protein QGG54_08605 [Gammaproteobacteria bacterium]|jgi:hypothetical protein|nr:hypothetical protein [Gammaproteobacteria bacterium]MDP6653541.1 hypothetical protein [Gammaproteobacteria bacterium]
MEDDSEPKSKPSSSRSDEADSKTNTYLQALRKISRARTRMIVCVLTLPVYIFVVWELLADQRNIGSIMLVYMAIWTVFAIDMASQRCPACGNQFFVKVVMLNLLSHRCRHCDLELDGTEASQEDSNDL